MLFFVLDDTFVYDAPPGAGAFLVDITYWDGDASAGGGDAIILKWDGNASREAPLVNSPEVNIDDIKFGSGQNTRQWRTRRFTVTEAKFANRVNARQDFYIGSATGVWIHKIEVTKPASLVTTITLPRMGSLAVVLNAATASGW